ncbi:hypothetical protein [Azospirillum sp.]|uniref:hypothetical protein n=1 Tax=Azospirillum sp. TaxID=34012 RepID=UPI002D2E39AB|nr:hypothetical protein [Azospirillum sp.]HYD66175.1 hypothetical protein [Azospirillum sp.]
MPATPLDILAEELGAVAGRIEREAGLRIEAAIADLRRIDAERELRLVNLERAVADRLASVRDGESVTVEQLAPLVDDVVARAVAALPAPKDGESVTVDDVRPVIEDAVGKAVAALPPAKDGDSVTVEQLAPLVDDVVAKAVAALPAAKDGESVTVEQLAPLVEDVVAKAVAALPVPKDGDSVTVEQLAPLVAETVEKAVAALPAPKDGESVTVEQLAPLVEDTVAKAVAALPVPKDGDSVTIDDVRPLIDEAVGKAVAALPAPKDGESVTVEQLAPLVDDVVAKAVAALPKPEKGDRGADGKMPVVRAWSDRVHYEGEVVTLAGSTWQAAKDTGHAPPHADWTCIAAAGRDGRSPRVRETFDAGEQDYRELDIVALGGAAFIARKDNPGPCPGAGWQVISTQGKTGKPGERGGVGPRGAAGPAIIEMAVDGQGLLTLVNADGSTVECDLYPVLSKLVP